VAATGALKKLRTQVYGQRAIERSARRNTQCGRIGADTVEYRRAPPPLDVDVVRKT